MDFIGWTAAASLAWAGIGVFGGVFTLARFVRNRRYAAAARANLAQSVAVPEFHGRTLGHSDRDSLDVGGSVSHSGTFDAGKHLDKLRNGATLRTGDADPRSGTVRLHYGTPGGPRVFFGSPPDSSASTPVAGRL